ncbi:MAG: aminotransferase class III-fold pyridoxal phosphate-dependent enzyme [Candidatus Hadarchaeales archaeon]
MKAKKSIELWKRAKKIIPGGTQLLSKRSEMFLPEQWPSYFQKAKGVEVWDLDGNRYIDTYMGIGACILGYADEEVNSAVKKVIDEGSMCTLNSPEEVELAELLLKLHPWAEMVRYTRTGGEAMAVAVRIARAYSGKDKVAFCGYHGWHDWYLAANLADERSLDGHLLPGLKPLGVPRALKGTAVPFHYNKIEELEEIVRKNGNIGAIVMEPRREQEPKNNFLRKVRRIADEIGAVLIFDEISSGWRMNVGGIHMLYGVHPDISVFGKAMSNGFPMGAVIGRGEVMDVAQESFISSTYWTERIGPAAAIATIRKLKKCKVPAHVKKIGGRVMDGWKRLADENGLKLEVVGMPALATCKLNYGEINQEIYTLFTQEMLQRGFLASKSFYVSYSHTEECIERYLENVAEVFGILARAIAGGRVKNMLKGPVAHAGFKRLT